MQLGETALASNFFNVAILALSGQELYFLTLALNDAVQIRRQKTRFRRCFPARAPPSQPLNLADPALSPKNNGQIVPQIAKSN